jgi:copper chaperone CopZ
VRPKAQSSAGRRLSIGAAVLAAIAASSCCIAPLVLAALGIGGAGAFVTLASYRPYILSVTIVLLAVGFYLTYRRPTATVDGDACACERPKVGRAGRWGLWIATLAVVLLAAFPTLAARLAGSRLDSHLAITSTSATQTVVVSVRGIDCEACAIHLKAALDKVGGLRKLDLDIPGQAVTVVYEPASGRLDAYVAAINALGYEATLPTSPGASR